MKRIKFLSLALAALALGACSSSDDVAEGGGNESNTSYVAVNIMSVGGTTRAADYENGLDVENAIDAENLAFYFFDASGQPYQMTKAGGTTNKVKPTAITWHDQTSGGNTTRISDAILVLNGTTKTKPYSVVVVANTAIAADELISLNDLRAKVDEYATTDKFVMSSSVYKSVCETPVGEFIKDNETDATNNPVDLYIERVSAKVVATIPVGAGSGWTWDGVNYKIKVGTTTTTGEDVYAVVKGWGVADSKKYSYLFKQVTDSWDDATIGFAWNDNANHRSYWATTYSGSSPAQEVVNQSYNAYTTKNTWGDTNPLYPRENTPTTAVSDLYNGNSLSKILLVAELQDNLGNPIEYCTYRGIEYLGEDAVKTQIAGEWASKYYYEESPGVYASIKPEHLIFMTKDDFSGSVPGTLDKGYKVVAQLASTAPEFYTKSGSSYTTVTHDAVNDDLDDEVALIRKGGAAYYYAPIKHLGTTGKVTEYGVVRNHVYKIDITDMKGFGTPVYDPDEKIIPETPDDTPAYLATKINVLSWRIVSQSVSLDKTK